MDDVVIGQVSDRGNRGAAQERDLRIGAFPEERFVKERPEYRRNLVYDESDYRVWMGPGRVPRWMPAPKNVADRVYWRRRFPVLNAPAQRRGGCGKYSRDISGQQRVAKNVKKFFARERVTMLQAHFSMCR